MNRETVVWIHTVEWRLCRVTSATSLIQIRTRRCRRLGSILISSLQFHSYPRLLSFDRQQKRHGRLIDFLNFPPAAVNGPRGGGNSFQVFAELQKGRKSPITTQTPFLPFLPSVRHSTSQGGYSSFRANGNEDIDKFMEMPPLLYRGAINHRHSCIKVSPWRNKYYIPIARLQWFLFFLFSNFNIGHWQSMRSIFGQIV